jgi:hypothetical protein
MIIQGLGLEWHQKVEKCVWYISSRGNGKWLIARRWSMSSSRMWCFRGSLTNRDASFRERKIRRAESWSSVVLGLRRSKRRLDHRSQGRGRWHQLPHLTLAGSYVSASTVGCVFDRTLPRNHRLRPPTYHFRCLSLWYRRWHCLVVRRSARVMAHCISHGMRCCMDANRRPSASKSKFKPEAVCLDASTLTVLNCFYIVR